MRWLAYSLCLLFVLIARSPFEPAFGATTIGNTTIVVKTVTGTITEGKRYLRFEDDIYRNEVVETFVQSATEIKFLDDTTISLGPDTSITLDRFVYDPDPKNSTFVLTITEGALRFATGVLPSTAYRIHTPVSTIGIRGTVIDVVVTTKAEPRGVVQTSLDITVIEGEAHLYSCASGSIVVPEGQSRSIVMGRDGCSSPRQPDQRSETPNTSSDAADEKVLSTGILDWPFGDQKRKSVK